MDTAPDLDISRRPGYQQNREPQPWPFTKYPPVRQARPPSVPKHNRPNKTMPPVYGTAVPLKGLSGAIRKYAYSYPDHMMRHWTVLLFADRVDSWEHRARKLAPFAIPAAVAFFGARIFRGKQRAPSRGGGTPRVRRAYTPDARAAY